MGQRDRDSHDAVRALICEIPGASEATIGALELILAEAGGSAPETSVQALQGALLRIREREGYGRSTSRCLMAVGFVDPELVLTADGLSALRAIARCPP
jgi:hypothetical protein